MGMDVGGHKTTRAGCSLGATRRIPTVGDDMPGVTGFRRTHGTLNEFCQVTAYRAPSESVRSTVLRTRTPTSTCDTSATLGIAA